MLVKIESSGESYHGTAMSYKLGDESPYPNFQLSSPVSTKIPSQLEIISTNVDRNQSFQSYPIDSKIIPLNNSLWNGWTLPFV